VFSAPLWLYGLATLAIPLALHLWSRRPRHVIRVGSLRHLTDLAEARSWSARLTQPLLLALRLGILTSIVLALAGPRIPGRHLGGRVGQLVLIDPALLSDSGLIRSDPLLDSLTRSRATIRLLAPELPKVQLDGVRTEFRVPGSALTRNTPGTRNAERGTIWDLLVSADHLVSRDGEMIVIARPRMSVLGGRRPALRSRVRWHAPVPAPAASWPAATWRTPGDSLLTLTGWGTAEGVSYRSVRSPVARADRECPECVEPGSLAVLVSVPDSVASRRLRLAVVAVATMLGQRVIPAITADAADLILTTSALSDSVLRLDRPVASLAPAVVGSPALADSVLAHWPWQPLGRDESDPREATLSQALPAAGSADPEDSREARIPLLLAALVLLTLERWIATRPAGRSA
jgi:hypothetical protein